MFLSEEGDIGGNLWWMSGKVDLAGFGGIWCVYLRDVSLHTCVGMSIRRWFTRKTKRNK